MRTDKIGINISRLRIERGITQEQLGRDIGLTASAISNIECGRSVPSVDTLCRFSELFGVKVDTILSDKSDSDLNKLEMEEKLVTVAINNNLIAEDSLDRGFSDQEADGILDKFDDLYYGEFWPEDIENVSYKENVSQLQFFDIKDYKEDENIIYIDESAAKNLKKGDTFVFDYMGEKIAKKIVEDMGNGTFSLEDPEIDEVFNTLIVSDSASIGIDDIISYYGLDNVKVSAGKPVTMLTADVSGNIHSKGFAIEAGKGDYERI